MPLPVCQILAKLKLFEALLEHDDALQSAGVILVYGEASHSIVPVAEHLDALRLLGTIAHPSSDSFLKVAAVGDGHDVIDARKLIFEDRTQQIQFDLGLTSLPNQYLELKYDVLE